MFYLDPINKNKLDKVTTPVDLEEYPINPRNYDYTIDFVGNIQDGKGCILTIDSIQPFEIDGNNQNTIQNDVLLIPPKKTIRFVPHQKPFVFYHTKSAYQSDMLIIPFDLTVSFAPSNRIYPTCYLLFFVGVLRYPFDHWPTTTNENKPLTFDHIQMTSKNDKKEINLIYAPTFDKQFHSLSMTNHSLPIIFNHFLCLEMTNFICIF